MQKNLELSDKNMSLHDKEILLITQLIALRFLKNASDAEGLNKPLS